MTGLGHEVISRSSRGIVMARQAVGEREAFELLRAQSRRSGRELFDVADAVLESHLLLIPSS